MLMSCYKKVKFRKAELVIVIKSCIYIPKIMTYLLMSPMERPKGWEFNAYFIYLKFDRDALLETPKSTWPLTTGERAFVAYADVISSSQFNN